MIGVNALFLAAALTFRLLDERRRPVGSVEAYARRVQDVPAGSEPNRAAAAVAAAERLGDLADTAELMGDDENAARLRARASVLRAMAFHELDHRRAATDHDA